jgi:hypothetical protein
MFVAGEPGPPADPMRDVEGSMALRLTGSVIGGWISGVRRQGSPPSGASALPSSDDSPWHLPPQQIQCVNLVLDLAKRAGRRVTLIDVNRPAGNQNLVDRWVGSNGLVPMLVRSDGARLQGLDDFVPATVRRFIAPRRS